MRLAFTDAGNDPATSTTRQAFDALATGFGQETIAEGVEDEETLVLLRELGVDFAQGFHIGQPTRHVAVAR